MMLLLKNKFLESNATILPPFHLTGVNSKYMTTFLIILGALLVTNYLLLQFSCNDVTDPETPEEE